MLLFCLVSTFQFENQVHAVLVNIRTIKSCKNCSVKKKSLYLYIHKYILLLINEARHLSDDNFFRKPKID